VPSWAPLRAQSEGRCEAAAIGDAAGGNYRQAHGVDDLRYQRHRPDQAGSRAAAEAAAMAAGVKSLRDDDVGAVCFERTRLGHRRRRAEDDATGFLHSPNCGGIWQAKVKADNLRPQLENELEPFFVEGWKRHCRLRDRSQPKFVEIGCEPCSHAGRRFGVEPRV
jgi:hypothetical protein